jgi:membrane-bound lytic murein transglycosylase D
LTPRSFSRIEISQGIMITGKRLAAVCLLIAAAGLAGCSSTPVAVVAAAPVVATPPPEPPRPTTRDAAAEGFRRGKALALAGDADCARLEFQEALETFRAGARPGDADDAAFAEQLWQGVLFYESLADQEESERPPVEDVRDTLLGAENAPSPTPEQVERAKREVTTEQRQTAFDIPVVVNDAVLRAVAFYQFRTPKAFAGALQRSGRYLPMMRRILHEEGLPEDLVYMAMIESAFKPAAHSRARAHGFWQFIDGTARRYGLRHNRYVDERSDPEKSTRAAARYLKDLYEMFGDWYLAMAAYSAGEGKVLKGLQRLGVADFWQLAAGSYLRRETREYVPFVIAAALISKDPGSYGFDVVPDPPFRFDVVRAPRPTDLARVAEAAGAPPEELQLLNSELKTRVTPQGLDAYPIRVPEGSAERVTTRLASLPPAPAAPERRIVVRKGESVARVAARAGVTIRTLCSFNDLPRNARLRKGQVLVVPSGSSPRRPSTPARLAASSARDHRGGIRALPTPAAAVTRAGEVPPFTSAAGPEPAALLSTRVEIPPSGFEAAPAVKPPAAVKSVRYRVRRGDNLYRIAARFGLTVEAICRENGLRAAETLRAGSRLTLTIPLALAR